MAGSASKRLFGAFLIVLVAIAALASVAQGTVYKTDRFGFHLRLRVEEGRLVAVHARVLEHCKDGSKGPILWNFPHLSVRIHPDGSFRFVPFFTSRLKGTLEPGAIRGRFRDWEQTPVYCTNGGLETPGSDFLAKQIR